MTTNTTQHPMIADRHFLLGTFASNCSGGMTVSTLPDRWSASWEDNLRLGKLLDAAGIDFMLPIARWIGYGGATDFHGYVLETMTWAAALLAKTERITVFATIHTTANHPVVVAKQIATLSHVSRGRVGLNIVAGWNKPEYEALGLVLPDDHDTRYGYAQEWFDFVKRLWTEDAPFDFHGQYFNTQRSYSHPHPVLPPPIVNAAGSGQGRQFALRNTHFLFCAAIDLERSKAEVADLKAQSAQLGRTVDVLTFAHVVCRPTESEAKAEWQRQLDNADWPAVDNLVRLQFAHAHSFPHDLLALIRERMATGHGGFPLVGTAQQVADGILALHAAGFRGTTLSFLDYAGEFPYFRDTVLPLLAQAGIR